MLALIDCRSKGYYKSEKFGFSYHGKNAFNEAIKSGEVSADAWEQIKAAVQDIISHEIEGKEFVGDEAQIEEQNFEDTGEELSKAEIAAEEDEAKNKTTFVKEE